MTLRHSSSEPVVKEASYLSTQLREGAPYLRDAGWRETATLLTLAAEEIEQLRRRIAFFEQAQTSPAARPKLRALIGRRFT